MFQCPFIMMTEVGVGVDQRRGSRAPAEYLQKGGFLWADDFWGSYAWEWWDGAVPKVLPPAEYPDHRSAAQSPLFSAQFLITKVPQIASIGYWASSGGGTSERGEDSAVAHTRARSSTSTATSWC